jgi:outer membrane lipoprotein-sorting protein
VRRALILPALLAFSMAAAATPDPPVEKIIDDYVAARGGLAKIKALQTLRQKGHVYADGGREAIVLRELKRPGKIRFEFTLQGMTGVYVVENGRGWQVAPFEGDMQARPMPEEAVVDAMEQVDLEGPLVDWKAKGHRVELAGHERVGGKDAYKIKITLKSGVVRYEYVDVATHHQLRTDTTRKFSGRELSIVTTFSGHKKTDGLLFPRSVEVTTEGRPQKLRVSIDSIEVNPALSDDRFRRPKSVDQ